jgi:hypothetical protein
VENTFALGQDNDKVFVSSHNVAETKGTLSTFRQDTSLDVALKIFLYIDFAQILLYVIFNLLLLSLQLLLFCLS